MSLRGPFKLPFVANLFIALGAGFLALACEASLDTVCFDGDPCVAETGTQASTSSASGTTKNPTDFPCDVFAVLEAKCHNCHNADHVGGAPIDLLECGRFIEDDCGSAGPRHLIAANYVTSDFMPLGADLTMEEKATLLDWLDAGAPCLESGGCAGTAGPKACYE